MLDELKKESQEAKQKRQALELELSGYRGERQRLQHAMGELETRGSAAATRLKDTEYAIRQIEAKIGYVGGSY